MPKVHHLSVMFRFNHSVKKGVGEDTRIEIRISSHTDNEVGEITPSDLGKEGLARRERYFVSFCSNGRAYLG